MALEDGYVEDVGESLERRLVHHRLRARARGAQRAPFWSASGPLTSFSFTSLRLNEYIFGQLLAARRRARLVRDLSHDSCRAAAAVEPVALKKSVRSRGGLRCDADPRDQQSGAAR